MSKNDGIVRLEELLERGVFIELEESDKIRIKGEMRRGKEFHHFLIENGVKDWFYGKTEKLKLYIFKELANVFDIRIKGMAGKQGLSIKYPKFPFDFTTREGVRFIACLLGDGCIHDKGIRYYNKDEILIDKFIYFLKRVFGYVPYKKYENQTEITVSVPIIYKKIVGCIGLKPGPKTSINQRVPPFIFNLSKDKKIEFISQFIDDDGYISDGNIGIDLSFDEDRNPLLLYDIKKLLKSLGIKCSVFPASEYYSLDGKKRRMWRLGIFLFSNVKRLAQDLKLNNSDKKKRCKELLKLERKEYNNLDVYLQRINELQEAKEFFTVVDLANISNRSIIHSRRIIKTARDLGHIKLLRPACKGYKNISYATYQVIK